MIKEIIKMFSCHPFKDVEVGRNGQLTIDLDKLLKKPKVIRQLQAAKRVREFNHKIGARK